MSPENSFCSSLVLLDLERFRCSLFADVRGSSATVALNGAELRTFGIGVEGTAARSFPHSFDFDSRSRVLPLVRAILRLRRRFTSMEKSMSDLDFDPESHWVDQESLDVLINYLTSHKRRMQERHLASCRISGDPWHGAEAEGGDGFFETPASLSDDNTSYRSKAESALKAHKVIQDTLMAIKFFSDQRCNAITRTLEDRLHVRDHDYKPPTFVGMVPDELWAYIFELTQEETRDNSRLNSTAFVISHSCHRFRRLAVENPALWTHLSNEQSPPEVEACLVRTRGRPLDVSLQAPNPRISGPKYRTRCDEFLELVSVHQNRWRHFLFVGPSSHEDFDFDDLDFQHMFICLTRHLVLPKLETIRIYYSDVRHVNCLRLPAEHEYFYISHWEMPDLRSLSVNYGCADLKETTGRWAHPHWELRGRIDVGAVMHFLDMSSLREIVVDAIPTLLTSDFYPEELASIYLPNLLCVSINASLRLSSSFLERLITPTLEKLKVHVHLQCSESFPQGWLVHTLPLENKYLYLKELDFKVSNMESYTSPFGDSSKSFFSRFSQLQHLSLDAPNITFPIDFFHDMVALHTLRLSRCNYLVLSDLIPTVPSEAWNSLQRLEVLGCSVGPQEMDRFPVPDEKRSWSATADTTE